MGEVWSVWPCDHGGVQVERVAVPERMECHQCGAHPVHVVPAARAEKLVAALREIADRFESDRREPDKILCHVLSMRRALAEYEGGEG